MGKIKLFDYKKKEWYWVKTRKKPKGYIYSTNLGSRKELEKEGYRTRVGLSPHINARYEKPKLKVLYYKIKKGGRK